MPDAYFEVVRLVSSRLALVRPVRVHKKPFHRSQLTYAPQRKRGVEEDRDGRDASDVDGAGT